MVRRRTTNVRSHTAGYSMTELLVVIGMIAVLATLAAPQFLSFWRTSSTTAAASELVATLNRARQLAISGNQNYCAEVSGTSVRFRQNTNSTCTAGAVWTGPGTDGGGLIRLQNDMRVSGGPVVFTSLGAAALGGTFTVTNPTPNGGSRNVIVAPSGRVRVQ